MSKRGKIFKSNDVEIPSQIIICFIIFIFVQSDEMLYLCVGFEKSNFQSFK